MADQSSGERRGGYLLDARREAQAGVEEGRRRGPQGVAAGKPAPQLGGRVDRLHARYRLGLEAKRAAAVHSADDADPALPAPRSHPSLLRRLGTLVGSRHDVGAVPGGPLRVVHNHLVIAGLDAGLDGFTLLHLSDLHLDSRSAGPMAQLIEAACSRPSDVLVLTGDLFARQPSARTDGVRALAPLLQALGSDTPAFAVLGDEDTLQLVPALEQLGIRVLLNESVAVERGDARLHLAGIDDPAYYKADDIDAALQSIPAGATSILLSHSPEVYRRAADAGFDVLLCGHTHGGQVCLPNGQPLLRTANSPRAVCRGRWRHGSLQGFTSSGCGTAPLNLRWNCPREVVFHTLNARRRAAPMDV